MTFSQSQLWAGIVRYDGGYLAQRGGAGVRAHARNGAMILTLDGELGAANTESVATTLARFISVRTPLVLDLRGLRALTQSGWRALVALGYWYREAGVPYVLVPGPVSRPYLTTEDASALPVARSLSEAMQRLNPRRRTRRRQLPIVARKHTRC